MSSWKARPVYTQPNYDITWGLVRDTRQSILDPGPWPDVDVAVRYYYLLGMEEGCATSWPDDPSAILWCGYLLDDGLPQRPTDIPETHRHTRAKPMGCDTVTDAYLSMNH